MMPSNIAPSRALCLSGRFSETTATWSATSMRTRGCSIGGTLERRQVHERRHDRGDFRPALGRRELRQAVRVPAQEEARLGRRCLSAASRAARAACSAISVRSSGVMAGPYVRSVKED